MRRFLVLVALMSACATGEVGSLGPGQEPDAGAPPNSVHLPDAAPSPSADARPAVVDARAPDALVPSPDAAPPGPVATGAYLDIHAMDVWAQYLPANARLRVSKDGATLSEAAFPVRRVPLAAGDYHIELEAPDHDPLAVTVRFDGSAALGAAQVTASDARALSGVSLSHQRETIGGKSVVVHRLFLGLRHRWFAASGRPARRGNAITLFVDHAEAWSDVYAELGAARESIHIASWWFDSTFELLRDLASPKPLEQRRLNTILNVLENSPAVKRVLIGQFLGQNGGLENFTTDEAIRSKGKATGDRFEYMGQGNPSVGQFLFALDPFALGERIRASHPDLAGASFDSEPQLSTNVPSHTVNMDDLPVDLPIPHASMHQKLIVVDDAVAFVGGMNFHPDDWDTAEHRVFDPRRMNFDASTSARADVAAKKRLPDRPPRKDYMMRIDGPAVQDVTEIFKARWDLAIGEDVDYSRNATGFAVGRGQGEVGDAQIQITTTLPDPLWEHSIAESWLNAVSQAEDYIYIEDQYFRAQMLNDAIYQRMLEVPTLKLVVISMPVSEWTDPACLWTARSHQLFRGAFPDRFQAVMLRAFDSVVTWGWDETESRFVDLYNHSKMLIIDDRFMSVGSANKNNRGMIYEAEMNVAVFDDAWVRAERRRIFQGVMPGVAIGDDPGVWFQQIRQFREWNDYVYANWDAEGGDISLDGAAMPEKYRPEGLLYSLPTSTPSSCLLEGIGPDVM